MLKICVEVLSEKIKCFCDLQSFLKLGRKISKTVYYIGCNLGYSGGRTGLRFIFSRFLYYVS
ncbi:hypothetical protein KSS87_010892 [Heliosperma pusillum]|nr:hypothetical protein KSS87_010892 [Heliosperma pusillum]